MKKETLEEAAERTYQKGLQDDIDLSFYDGVRLGSKWQEERMYSEEEVLEIIRQYALEEHLITSSKPDIWFEQFKKK